MSQLGLFGSNEEEDQRSDPTQGKGPVAAATPSEAMRALGARLPATLRMGTSSWSFPGWADIVYDRKTSQSTLAQHGLAAYAQHPLFRSVGIDRTYYGPVSLEVYQKYAAAVPDDFRFLVKAHEWLTRASFPRHPRYGSRRGEENPHFLDSSYAIDEVVGPTLEGLGSRLGTLLFQFSPGSVPKSISPDEFVDRLLTFLNAMPDGLPASIELRDPRLLTRRYRDALLESGAVHCLNAIGGMPRIPDQWKFTAHSKGPLVVRWMLHRRHDYQGAKQRFAPFNQLAAPDPETRSEITRAIELAGERDVIVIVNNKAEGSSPLSVLELARSVSEMV